MEYPWLYSKSIPCIMGCTSSAPNMVATNPNATEKISEFEEETGQSINEDDDIISAEEENGKNEIKVLPSCDTLADPIQLDSNNKSMIDTSNLDMEKDIPDESNMTESVTENIAKEVAAIGEKTTGEKISSLEDIVEKVVELYFTESLINNSQNVPKPTDQIDDSIEKAIEEPDKLPQQSQEPKDEPQENKEETLQEAISPSQSTSSRATRWEALADIAAELPPSLTVDPVTGQIYALSK